MNRVFWTGLALAGSGLVWSLWPVEEMGETYAPVLKRSTYKRGPRVMIDEGHWNLYRASGRLQPFARLLLRDGYRVSSNKQKLVPALLEGTDVLVIAGALGFAGAVERLGGVGLGLATDAFAPEEVNAVHEWVRAGGSLLLATGQGVCSQAARRMVSSFGVNSGRSEFGSGRVAVLEDAAELVAKENKEQAIEIAHWLSRAPLTEQ